MSSTATTVPDERRKVYRVAEITRLIKSTLEDEIGYVWIEGEISNFLHHGSGHMYFALKDAEGLIQAAMFRGAQRGLGIKPENGQLVRAYGRVTAYPARSQFQIVVEKLEAAGKGSLQEAFEKLKAKLAAEGLFDAARKKKLPVLPQHIGLVTSPTGAAVRDMLNVLGRRFPNLHIVLAPVRVQGEGAAQEIAAAIHLFNEIGGIDVLIVGRGGGSLEDLWPFNEEIVARAVARSAIPIVSAVGHETDFTICDFAADLRAPTPSAAAELVVRPKQDFLEDLDALRRHLANALRAHLLEFQNRFTRASRSYVFREPGNLLQRHRQHLDALADRMRSDLRASLAEQQQRLDESSMRLAHRLEMTVQGARQAAQRLSSQLSALSPLAVLDRGYSVTTKPDGSVVRDPDAVRAGDTIVSRLSRGSLTSTITDTKRSDAHGGK